MIEDERTFLTKVIRYYGYESQIRMMFEEMAELQKELCKRMRGENNRNHIIEEIADVEIMLDQITIMFEIDWLEVAEIREEKIARLKKRIEGN